MQPALHGYRSASTIPSHRHRHHLKIIRHPGVCVVQIGGGLQNLAGQAAFGRDHVVGCVEWSALYKASSSGVVD
jgi:hypothetical protein